jgi:RHS repeat-associated protein
MWFKAPLAICDQFDYTYDYAGNRLCRDIPNSLYATDNHDETYAYDGLLRLQDAQRGTYSSGSITSRQFEQQWTLDGLGNWDTVKERDTDADPNWDFTYIRGHNKANELVTFITGTWAQPVLDAAGNMTTIPQPANPNSGFALKYDAWNRMVEVKAGANLVQKNKYDGLHRRIVKEKYVGGALNETRHYYYNDAWQVVEERVGANPATATVNAQYVWHPQYVDSLAVRYWDHDDNSGTALVAHYYLQDANYNVTAVTDSAGAVVERYAYTPYGEVTVLDANFGPDADQISDIANVCLYTGRERDPETGLQLNRLRFYAAHIGRWLGRDPIEYSLNEYNLYQYVSCDPVSFTDPLGLRKVWPAKNPYPPGRNHDNFNRGCIGLACLRIGGLDSPETPSRAPGTKCFANEERALQEEIESRRQGNSPCVFVYQNTKSPPPCATPPSDNVDPKYAYNFCVDPQCVVDSMTAGGGYNFCSYVNPIGGKPYWEWMGTGKNGNDFNIKRDDNRPGGVKTEIFCVVPNCKCPSTRKDPGRYWEPPHDFYDGGTTTNPSFDKGPYSTR